MKRSPLTVAGVVLLSGALVVACFKLSAGGAEGAGPDGETPAAGEQPRRSKWFWQSDAAPTDALPAAAAPAPTRRSLRVIRASTSEPVGGAKVKVLRSSLLDSGRPGPGSHPPLNCDDLEHLTETAARLRGGTLTPELLAEGTTNAEGVAELPERAWPELSVVVVEAPGLPTASLIEQYRRDEIVIADDATPAPPLVAHVFDSAGNPVSGARLTLVDLVTGEVRVERTGSAGDARLDASDTRWVITEAEGYFPMSMSLEGAGAELQVMLSRPGTVEVTAPPALGPFGVKLVKRHERVHTVRDGRTVFEHERVGAVSVQVTEPGLLGAGDGMLEEGQRLVIALQVKRAGRLLLTVVDETGNPVPDVVASLSAPSATVSASATEEGQRLELGPIGEGPAVLQVSAPRFKSRAQSLELGAGDTDLEVVLVEAPLLRGRVVDAKGQPVAEVSVQVQSDVPNDPAGAVTGPDGAFTLHVEDEGSWRVEALGPEGEVARATAQVPGSDVVLTLEPLGRAEVIVYGPDGRPAEAARVMVASAESPEPDFGESTADGTLLFEALVPGDYRVEVDDGMNGEQFLRYQGELAVRSGQTSSLTVRLRPSARVVGRLVDSDGEALPSVILSVKGDGRRATETTDDGSFELLGLEPGGRVELALEGSDFVGLSPSTLAVGGPAVTVRALRGERVSGRVVDEQGAPVPAFMVNGHDFDAEDGRFEASADAQGSLVVTSYGDSIIEVQVKVEGRKDVGDVVLKRSAPFAGVVLDELRQPLASVRVVSREFVLGEVLTDARGRFEADLLTGTTAVTLEARHGELGTFVTVPADRGSVELVLVPATRVSGVVRGSGGRAIVTTVVARGPADEELRVDTDAQGRFPLSVAPGNWFFGTRASRSSLAVAVAGRDQRVDLGVPDDACEISVRGVPLPTSVFLVPAGSPWVPDEMTLYETTGTPAGTVALGLDGAAFIGRGLPCGAYGVHALYGPETVSSQATLTRGAPAVVTVHAPSLATVGDAVGMRHPGPIRLEPIELRELVGEAAPKTVSEPVPQVVE